jgi:YqaJ-like viral recombinase domain
MPSKATRAASKKPPEDLVEVFTAEDTPQRGEDWYALRLGIPTASNFSIIMADGRNSGPSVSRESYMKVLAGEIITKQPREREFENDAMRRGHEMEPEALAWYERTHFVDLERIGFVRRTVRPLGDDFIVGCSPDAAVVGRKNIIEVKTLRPDLLIDVQQKGASGFPAKHRAQCQGNMWIMGAETCELILFYRGWPRPPKFTIPRDEQYIKRLSDEVERFSYELKMLVKEHSK